MRKSHGHVPELPNLVKGQITQQSRRPSIVRGLTGAGASIALAGSAAIYFASAYGSETPVLAAAVAQAPALVSDIRTSLTAPPPRAVARVETVDPVELADAPETDPPSRLGRLAQPVLPEFKVPVTQAAKPQPKTPAARPVEKPKPVVVAKAEPPKAVPPKPAAPPKIVLSDADRVIPTGSVSEVLTRLPEGERRAAAKVEPATAPAKPVQIAKVTVDGEAVSNVATGAVSRPAAGGCSQAITDQARRATVWFRVGSADITSGHGNKLQALAKSLRSCRTNLLEIGGHTDSVGSDASNFRLSWQRAEEVAARLVAAGIPKDRLVVVGYGSQRPFVETDAADVSVARSVNRRVEIRVR
ncbi:MAG: OmpA family protein [Pseudomonadota bacterium]